MDKKTENTYWHIFNYIENNIFNLAPKSFNTDYECGMQNALKRIYPNAQLVGCWFHYCQAVRRKIVQRFKNLQTYIKTSNQANAMYHKFLSLPLLPHYLIQNSFEQLKLMINIFDKDQHFDQFVAYFEKQWIKKVNMPECKININTAYIIIILLI